MTSTALWLSVNTLDVLLLNLAGMQALGLKLALNLTAAMIIVLLIYRPANDKPEYTFTYLIFNILIFFICHLMTSVDLGIGFGFGLFALFSIMRYRTMTISIKDMTYLFALVCLAVMNSISATEFSVVELLLINAFIVTSIFVAEKVFFRQVYDVKKVTYEYVDRIKPENEHELIEDLETRTGRKVVKIDVLAMNYLNDSASLRVYFEPLDKKSLIDFKEGTIQIDSVAQNGQAHKNQPGEYEEV